MTIQVLLTNILTIINVYLIPLLVAGTIVVFFYCIFEMVRGGDPGKATKTIGAGVVGLVTMLCIWGIVSLVGNSLGISGQQQITLPQIH